MAEAVNYNRFLVEMILKQVSRKDSLLDFGAGVGTFAHVIATRGYRVACIEPDPVQAERISSLGLQAVTDIDLVPDASFDLVYSLNVLEHIEDDLASLRKIYAKVRPGGRIFIYVPAFPCLTSAMDKKVGHLRRYTRKSLRTKLLQAGFTGLKDTYVDFLGFPATLAYKRFGRNDGSINIRALVIYDRLLFPLSRVLDRLFGRLLGKNALATAIRPKHR